jgi:uncharacterized membrane protein YraQ (UPF0718 family)
VIGVLYHTIYGAVLMLWETLWALVLGFSLSAVLQVLVRRESIMRHFGQANLRSVGLATFLGAVSSSCSYAAAAAAKSAFRKGAHLVPTLAFMFAATNLVLELGAVLWILLGWRFVLAEVVGAFVLIGFMWLLVSLTLPRGLMDEARRTEEPGEGGGCCHGGQAHDEHEPHGHDHGHSGHEPAGRKIAGAFFMDVGMIWKEILIGFGVAGFLMAAVPPEWWQGLFLTDAPWPLRLVENAVVGVLIAAASFVCSVGNLPLAALLWSGGIGFGGVISFIYADLVIVPLLLLYRKYYGLKAAAYIAAILATSMVLAGIVVDLLFNALGLAPTGPRPPAPMLENHFAWNYTTWLDLAALAVMAGLAFRHFQKSRPAPVHEEEPPVPHHPETVR